MSPNWGSLFGSAASEALAAELKPAGRGEVLGTRWDDLDLDNATWQVRRTLLPSTERRHDRRGRRRPRAAGAAWRSTPGTVKVVA